MTNDERDIKRDILKRDILGKNKRTKEHEGFGQRKRDIFVITLVCVLFTFENNAGPTDLRSYGPTDGHDLL